jgi:hypothetical protein
MADTTTTHRGLTKIEVGASENSWGQKLNANADRVDLALGGTLTKGATSGTVALTGDEHGYSRIRLNGTLVGNLTVEFDGVRGGVWIIDNDTVAGGFSVTAKVTGQTGVIIPPGENRLVFFNGTDIEELGTAGIDAQVAALAALTPAAGQAMYWTSATALALADTAGYGRSLWNVADEAALKALINAEAGVDFQAYDADLAAIALLTTTAVGRSLLEVANAAAIRTIAEVAKDGVLSAVQVKTADYTLALTDIGSIIRINDSSVRDISIPLNATVEIPVGSWFNIGSIGTAAGRVRAVNGVTLNGVAGTGSNAIATFSARWRAALLVKVATNSWEIYGGVGDVST